MSKKGPILILGDTHFPFAHQKLIRKVADIAHQLKPRAIVQMGDLYDQYNASRFPKSHDIITPSAEITTGREQAEQMWALLRRKAPKARRFQLRGNHDERFDQRLSERLPEALALFNPKDLFCFDGVETVMDPKEEFILDGVCYMHGHRGRLGDHARYNRMNTVCGHSHTGGVVFQRDFKGIFWELNAGWLGDESKPVFAYGAQKHKNWTTGIGLIDQSGPRFIPL